MASFAVASSTWLKISILNFCLASPLPGTCMPDFFEPERVWLTATTQRATSLPGVEAPTGSSTEQSLKMPMMKRRGEKRNRSPVSL